MCFSMPSIPASKPIPATPTPVNTGVDEALQEAKKKDRERQRAAAGFQQNILGGAYPASGAPSGGSGGKQLLGQ